MTQQTEDLADIQVFTFTPDDGPLLDEPEGR